MLIKSPIRHHVFGDLRPYICLDDDCHLADKGFSRRKDWLNHMIRDHWRIWACPFGCPDLFATPFILCEHLSQNHGSVISVPDASVHTRANMELAKGQCPLCWEFKIMSPQQYQSHVGAHLEQLVLFVLPGSGTTEEASDVEEVSEVELVSDVEELSEVGEFRDVDEVKHVDEVSDEEEFSDEEEVNYGKAKKRQSRDESRASEPGHLRSDQERQHQEDIVGTLSRAELERRLRMIEERLMRAESTLGQNMGRPEDLGMALTQQHDKEVAEKAVQDERAKAHAQRRHEETIAEKAVANERARVLASQKHDEEVAKRAVERELARIEAENSRKTLAMKHDEEVARKAIEGERAATKSAQEQEARIQAEVEKLWKERVEKEERTRRREQEERARRRVQEERARLRELDERERLREEEARRELEARRVQEAREAVLREEEARQREREAMLRGEEAHQREREARYREDFEAVRREAELQRLLEARRHEDAREREFEREFQRHFDPLARRREEVQDRRPFGDVHQAGGHPVREPVRERRFDDIW